MCAKCHWFLGTLKSCYAVSPFITGMISGMILLVFVFLLLKIAGFFFRAKKVSLLSYALPNGMVSVRATAIADLVRSVSLDYPEFNVHSMTLLKKRKVIFLQVQVMFFQKERSFPDASSAFQQSVLTALKDSFGVSGVARVDVQLRSNPDQAK